jgi:hypothetical protein
MKRQNVFDWLDCVRARPSMYLRDGSLRELENLLWGYYTALQIHGIVEEVPAMNRHFLHWLYHRTGWPCSLGWAYAIGTRHPSPDEALAAFFCFVDEYRRLLPWRLCTVRLSPEHNPTGRRRVYGRDGRMEKPCRVDVVCYRPESLHFLRFHYPDRIEDDDLLMTGSGEYRTDLAYAQQWVRDELQVELGLWKVVDEKTGLVVE